MELFHTIHFSILEIAFLSDVDQKVAPNSQLSMQFGTR